MQILHYLFRRGQYEFLPNILCLFLAMWYSKALWLVLCDGYKFFKFYCDVISYDLCFITIFVYNICLARSGTHFRRGSFGLLPRLPQSFEFPIRRVFYVRQCNVVDVKNLPDKTSRHQCQRVSFYHLVKYWIIIFNLTLVRSSYMAFAGLAVVVLLGVIGVLAGNIYFWVMFTVFHVIMGLFISVQIYYLGRWRCGKWIIIRCGIIDGDS